jgi:hypothetical protein
MNSFIGQPPIQALRYHPGTEIASSRTLLQEIFSIKNGCRELYSSFLGEFVNEVSENGPCRSTAYNGDSVSVFKFDFLCHRL